MSEVEEVLVQIRRGAGKAAWPDKVRRSGRNNDMENEMTDADGAGSDAKGGELEQILAPLVDRALARRMRGR